MPIVFDPKNSEYKAVNNQVKPAMSFRNEESIPKGVEGDIALLAVAMTKIVKFFIRSPNPTTVQNLDLRGTLSNSILQQHDRESMLSPEIEKLINANAKELSKMAGFKDMTAFVKEAKSMVEAFDKIVPSDKKLNNVLKEVNKIKDEVTAVIKPKGKNKKKKTKGNIKKLFKKAMREL